MKPWREVIVPHADIRRGSFDESVFAAELSDVVADRGPLEYRDPALFFRKTYPTQGLRNLLGAVLSRLSGQETGEAVIQIQTPFGGGKTHALIALYHAVRNPEWVRDWGIPLPEFRTPNPESRIPNSEFRTPNPEFRTPNPEFRTAIFVGTAADPLGGKTPWGEIAAQLGVYEVLREHDIKRLSPGKDRLHALLGDWPTLILMDEIAEYAVKARDYQGQVMAFFQELTETVKVLPRCALVVTLPSSAPYGEEGERALSQLQRIFGRVEAIYTPVEGEEVYEIIRRRLFEGAPDQDEVARTANTYWEMYQRLGDDVPREVREPTYREKLGRAYPFHPELIDILFERWSTYPSFQRTRGVLRFLAEVVADLYRREHAAPLIQPAHINLTQPAIRRELLKHIGNEYEGVIAADIANSNAKAQKIEREMGSEYARFNIATGLATAIFFSSFSGAERKGTSIQRLRLAVLREGIQPALVGDTLQRLEGELWYLHVEKGFYWFSSQPNLNRIIVEREGTVQDDQIREELRQRMKLIAGSQISVFLWPRDSQDVPDTREMKLAVLSLDHPRQSSATERFVEELLSKCGQTFRVYRNTLTVLAIDENYIVNLKQRLRRTLALRSIHDDKALMRQLSEENRKALESKLKDSEGGVEFELFSAYRYLAKAGDGGTLWIDMGMATVGERTRLAERVYQYLRQEEYLATRISPQRVLDKTLRPDEEEKPLREVMDAFWRYPHLPMVDNDRLVLDAIRQGIREGLFGVRAGERVYFRQDVPDTALDPEAILVRRVEISPEAAPSPEIAPEPVGVAVGVVERPAGPPPGAPPSGPQTYTLRARVPWEKFSDLMRGVITPLQDESEELVIEIHLRARSRAGGFQKTTIDQKVRETLRQINAQVQEDLLADET